MKNISPDRLKGRGIEDIDYLLITYMSELDFNTENKMTLVKLGNNLNKFGKWSDHHLHYIIIRILSNTLNEAYNTQSIRINLNRRAMDELNYHLLVKLVEELFHTHNKATALETVMYASIPEDIKKRMIYSLNAKHFFNEDDLELNNKLSLKLVNFAFAQYSFYRFNFDKAITHYRESKDYEKAFEVYLYIII
jgi:hypothetical protein